MKYYSSLFERGHVVAIEEAVLAGIMDQPCIKHLGIYGHLHYTSITLFTIQCITLPQFYIVGLFSAASSRARLWNLL